MFENLKQVGLEVYQATCKIGYRLKKVGVWQGLRKVRSIKGMERLASVFIPFFALLQSRAGNRMDKWLEITEFQQSFYRCIILIPRLFKAIKDPSIARILKVAISVCEAVSFLQAAEICKFKVLNKILGYLSKYAIFQSPLIRQGLRRPQDLLILVLCTWKLIKLLQVKKRQEQNLLKIIHNVVQGIFIVLKSYTQEGVARFDSTYNVILNGVNLGAQIPHFIGYLIK